MSMCCRWLTIYLNNIYPDTERWKTKPFKTASLFFFVVMLHTTCLHGPECTSKTVHISSPLPWWKKCAQWHHHSETTAEYYREEWWGRPGRRGNVTQPLVGLTTPPPATGATIEGHHLKQRENICQHRKSEIICPLLVFQFQRSVASWLKHWINHHWSSVCSAQTACMSFFVIASFPSIIYPPNM